MAVTLDHWKAADWRVFNTKKQYIQGALNGETGIIDGVTEENKEDVFYMLMFCLCVPQSKAIKAESAIEILREQNYYSQHIPLAQIVHILTGRVRFHTVKAQRLVDAKELFFSPVFWDNLRKRYEFCCSEKVKEATLQSVRSFLMHRIKGMGMKLASHFMRNVGMTGLAILDVHVIDGLNKRGVINIDKLGPSQAEYLRIEEEMKGYAAEVGITLDELDLLLWSQKTGYVFK